MRSWTPCLRPARWGRWARVGSQWNFVSPLADPTRTAGARWGRSGRLDAAGDHGVTRRIRAWALWWVLC